MVVVRPHQWELYRFELNATGSQIESQAIGSCTQYPVKLAWAVTIHKSQGKTFQQVVLDIGRGTFSPGQLYVALSRCTTLEGITLKEPVKKHHIWTDETVVNFMNTFRARMAGATQ
jgi:ATP-dependent exoDNAse (exonuclease V) alpha subunit